jgi:hypothetical protein
MIILNFIAAIAAASLGVLADSILKPYLSKPNRSIVPVLIAVVILAILVILPNAIIFRENGNTITNPPLINDPSIADFVTKFGVLASSDKVFITGYLTIFLISGLIYLSVPIDNKRKYSPLIVVVFVSFFLIYLYFRLWLGENWWITACVLPLIIGLLISILYLSAKNNNSVSKYSIGMTSGNNNQVTLLLGVIFVAIFIFWGNWAFTNEKSDLSSFSQSTIVVTTSTTENLAVTREMSFPSDLEPIQFSPGATSHKLKSILEPEIPKGYQLYIFATQRLIVDINGSDVTMIIWDANGNRLPTSVSEIEHTEAIIPTTGYYIVAVYGDGEFELEITIPPRENQ